MKMRGRWWLAGCGVWVVGVAQVVPAQVGAQVQVKTGVCRRAIIEGEVAAGQSFGKMFTPGLKFLLEPIASGWIVRVLPVGEKREAHDYAELATPPYQSVTPLAVSTDFSFRAQDAVGWNPRGFRYAGSSEVFRKMKVLYAPVMASDAKAAGELAMLVTSQPEAELRVMEARLIPGTNDQAQMAAAVASHFATTPHVVEQTGASALGKLTWMRFKVSFDLRRGATAAAGIREENMACASATNR